MKRLTLIVLGTIFLFGLAGTVLAQTREVTDDEVNEVAEDLFCPVCESTPLDVCPTQACADWRALIRTQLAEGATEEEVHEYFARQYGDGVLADPPRRGVNWILWIFPVVAVVLGGGVFVRYLTRIRREESVPRTAAVAAPLSVPEEVVPPVDPDEANPDYLQRVEAELTARKS